jgi:hypothetical protein
VESKWKKYHSITFPGQPQHSGGKLLPHLGEGGESLRGNIMQYSLGRKTGKDPHQYSIGTWNVRTLNQGGKLENLKKEMEKNGVPTSDYEDEEVEELYDRIEDILEEDGKGDTNTIIMGDWNSVVGDKSNGNICGPYGLGNRNEGSKMLIDFCERTGLVITNTWFKKPKRRLYTWKLQVINIDISWIIYL